MDKTPKEKINDERESDIINDAKQKALERARQKAIILDIEDLADKEARKAADARMSESKESLKGVKGLIKKIWKHTFFDEYYRQKEISKVRRDIREEDNIYIGRDIDKGAHDEAMDAVSDRFISEYEGTLSEGEEKKVLNSEEKDDINTITNIQNLIKEYASGNLNEEAFKNEKVRILNEIDTTLNGESKGHHLYSDNLFEIAQNARIAIEHGAKLEELELDNNIILGKAKSSLKTEAHFNKVDGLIDKMKKSKIGRFVNPAVLNTSIGLAYSLSVLLTKKAAGLTSSIVPLIGSVAVSSAFAGMNESQRLALERAQHGVEMAEGGEFEKGSKRREQMENFAYQMESSNTLANDLRGLMFEKDKNGRDILKDIKEEDIKNIIANLANIEARNSLNAKNKIDLISYSDISNVEKERTDLTILVARAKVELRKKLNGELKNGLPKDEKDFDSYLAKQVEILENSLLGGERGINAQDKAFKKFKSKEVARKVLKNATFGFIIGATMQEAMAFGNDNTEGLIEGIFHHDQNATIDTPLNRIKDIISGNRENTIFHHFIDGTKETTVSADDYINNHLDEVDKVVRDGWYDNNTPKPIFDHNELKLQWGGDAQSAGIEDGKYALDISHMTKDGSFHEQFSVDAQEKMKNGALKVIFSLTRGTQDQVFEVPISPEGKALIDPDSEIGKLFFATEDGHAVFKGRFAEVVESFGSKDGAEHVKTLATLVGEGNNNIEDIIPVRIDTPIVKGIESPFYIPIMSRNPLEPLKKGDRKEKGEDKKVINDVIVGPEVVPDVVTPDDDVIEDYKILDDEITKEEKKFMEDDMKMLNEKVRNSKGIIITSEDEFKSKYGKRRYQELRHIGEGKPIKSFNMFELQRIGNEIESYLVKGVTSPDKKKVKPIKEEPAPEPTPKPEPRPEIKKDKVVIDDNKKNNVVDVDKSKEKVFTKKDLSYVGTEFENNKFKYKIISIKKTGFFGTKEMVLVFVTDKNDKEKKEELLSIDKKSLEKELKKKNIIITKSGGER